MDIQATFHTDGVAPGTYEAEIHATTTTPDSTELIVPVIFTVEASPRIVVEGEAISVVSRQEYSGYGARTEHHLPIVIPPAGNGQIDLFADGEFGIESETATAFAEGVRLG